MSDFEHVEWLIANVPVWDGDEASPGLKALDSRLSTMSNDASLELAGLMVEGAISGSTIPLKPALSKIWQRYRESAPLSEQEARSKFTGMVTASVAYVRCFAVA